MTTIQGYHAHVYYQADTRAKAEKLRAAIDQRFDTTLGRWHDRPIGPHPEWSYQIAFDTALFADLVPWLSLNRDDLTIFIHPLTGNDLADHSNFVMWLGTSATLDLGIFN
ncbi:MAG: DOPA 4,5-dioxygenase family protein [Alphaproteobacteria bacterium]